MSSGPEIFFNHLAPTSPSPYLIEVERAEGVYIFDVNGQKYFDLISGIGVSALGHGNPTVIRAIKEQVEKHLHVMVWGEFVQSAVNKLGSKLVKHLPKSLNCVYLVNSGTEANEGALKLGKRLTNRTEIVSFHKSYHGSTHGSLSVSGNELKKQAFRPLLPDVRFLRFNSIEDLEKISDRTACVIMETIQGDAGVRIPEKEFMLALRRRCDETGALLILDEIQAGMGRTGTLFAFEQFGIIPDILTLGKALGGGLPIGAFIARRDRMEAFTHDPMLGHITTFGGNPVVAAAAHASLEVLTEGALLASVEAKGRLFESLLKHDHIREVRRIGLMFAVDFDSPERVNRIVQNAKEMGVITYWFLSNPHSFRIAPPLVISESEIRECCKIIVAAIENS
jgi:acetylornithine/succinyldiaminopimelate/putrescine aminotransferase